MTPLLESLLKNLRQSEGFEEKAYIDTTGNLTIGYGLNLGFIGLDADFKPVNGIPQHIAELLLTHYVMLAIEELNELAPWIKELDEVRREVLYDMFYNMGASKFSPRKWPVFFGQVRDRRFEDAANNMKFTPWAKQVKSRAERLEKMMRTGRRA